ADPQNRKKVIISARSPESGFGLDLGPGCDFIRIEGFTFNNNGTRSAPAGTIVRAAIKLEHSQGNILRWNIINGPLTERVVPTSGIGGIYVVNVKDVAIDGNTLTRVAGTYTRGHGLYIAGGSECVEVADNKIFNNANIGIHINGDVSDGGPG